jgi:hypothetical protein
MYALLDLEQKSALWRKDGTTTFDDILREEHLCTPSRFKAFKKADGYFDRETIEKLGVPCVCLLSKQNARSRNRLLGKALQFREDYGIEPAYQLLGSSMRRKADGPSRKMLLAWIEELKKEIRNLGGRVPRMPQ